MCIPEIFYLIHADMEEFFASPIDVFPNDAYSFSFNEIFYLKTNPGKTLTRCYTMPREGGRAVPHEKQYKTRMQAILCTGSDRLNTEHSYE
jgi:hypothetical protein